MEPEEEEPSEELEESPEDEGSEELERSSEELEESPEEGGSEELEDSTDEWEWEELSELSSTLDENR